MITDLVRNDLGRVARTGSVSVPDLCVLEHHPGLVHLVSRVRCQLADDTTWADLLRATTPPGSVSGAPKSSALRAIANLEPTARGPYCGAVGWVRDRVEGSLAVGIRTFWFDCDHRAAPAADRGPASHASGTSGTARNALHFGTGAGIVWDSDPLGEWEETALKARRLIALASASTAEQRPGLVPDAADTPKGAA
jgi:para-aminobenzoate synthetase component 1